ncbi:MAG: hypothetical protein VB045_05305 [Synergistaceae bacterium]|nr:hypothetical protein [Synergistaceae bacterium]
MGNSSLGGICHSWSADGRCISLLKILYSNNCAYCVNRRSSDIPRASFTPVAFRGGYPSARNGNTLASLLVSTGKGSAAAEQLFFDFGS